MERKDQIIAAAKISEKATKLISKELNKLNVAVNEEDLFEEVFFVLQNKPFQNQEVLVDPAE